MLTVTDDYGDQVPAIGAPGSIERLKITYPDKIAWMIVLKDCGHSFEDCLLKGGLQKLDGIGRKNMATILGFGG